MKNIIQLYFDNKKIVPFVVRRETWSKNYGLLITLVHPRKTANGWFGDVVGFGLPPLNGAKQNDYWGLPDNPISVSCSGCYQWVLIEDIPPEWQKYINANHD